MKKRCCALILTLAGVLLILCSCNKTTDQPEIVPNQPSVSVEDTDVSNNVQDKDIVVGDTESNGEEADDEITETDDPTLADEENMITESPDPAPTESETNTNDNNSADNNGDENNNNSDNSTANDNSPDIGSNGDNNNEFDGFNGTGTDYPDDDSIMVGDNHSETPETPNSETDNSNDSNSGNDSSAVTDGNNDSSANSGDNNNDIPSENDIKNPEPSPSTSVNPDPAPSISVDPNPSPSVDPDPIPSNSPSGSVQPMKGNDPTTPPFDLSEAVAAEEIEKYDIYWYWNTEYNMWQLHFNDVYQQEQEEREQKRKEEFLSKYPTYESYIAHQAYNHVWVDHYRDYGVGFEEAVEKINAGEYAEEYQEAYDDWYNSYKGTDYWGIGVGN